MGALVRRILQPTTARKFILTGFASLFIAITLLTAGQLWAQDPAVVRLEPQTFTLSKGQTSSVVVRIQGAANVYGVQLDLSFDAQKIKILDQNTAKAGVQILSGDFLPLDEGFEAANEANNETGQLIYALSLLAPAEPVSGTGTLIEFEVEALETGSIDLLLDSVILASRDGALLPVQLPDDPDDDIIIVPAATLTEPAAPTAQATQNSPATATAAAENTSIPSSTAETAAESAAAATLVTASPSAGNTQSAAETGLETPTASVAEATSTLAVLPSVAELDPAEGDANTAEPAAVEPAAEIAAVPAPLEEEDSITAEVQPVPALTVIGQNPNFDQNQDQLATPAPSAASERSSEQPYVAYGLLLLIVSLIVIWFLWRLRAKTR